MCFFGGTKLDRETIMPVVVDTGWWIDTFLDHVQYS